MRLNILVCNQTGQINGGGGGWVGGVLWCLCACACLDVMADFRQPLVEWGVFREVACYFLPLHSGLDIPWRSPFQVLALFSFWDAACLGYPCQDNNYIFRSQIEVRIFIMVSQDFWSLVILLEPESLSGFKSWFSSPGPTLTFLGLLCNWARSTYVLLSFGVAASKRAVALMHTPIYVCKHSHFEEVKRVIRMFSVYCCQ